jgi:hypothetical protein
MARTVLKDFAYHCCQMFLVSMTNYDRINFVLFGDGIIHMDFLSMQCTHNNHPIEPLFYCTEFNTWLKNQCALNGLDMKHILKAELTVKMELGLSRKKETGWLISRMKLNCSSIIATTTGEYTASLNEEIFTGLGQILMDCQY